jgi:putative lipoic acid-binding regulatory protein
MHDPTGGSRPDIEYPCHWRYRVIGKDGLTLRAVIATILGDRQYSVADGNTSRGGKYRSLELDVVVDDEDTRLSIFYQLSWHADVAFVI